MTEYHFTLVLAPDPGLENGTAVEALGETGATDATIGRGADGVWTAVFHRDTATFEEALKSSIRDVRAARLVVRHVEPDDLVTQAEIAERLGRTSESVRLLTTGQRGNGTFPPPGVRITNRGSLWRWSEVAVWANLAPEEVEKARWIAIVNARLQFDLYDSPKEKAMLKEVAGILAGKRAG